jgi:quercetin dioxygenase-like cupin family protein
MTINPAAILRQPEEGDSYWVLGDLYTFKAIGETTGQAYALCEIVVQPQSGTPPHIHSHEDESFYVQEGELEFQLDEQVLSATPGTFLYSPKGQLHRFGNVGSTPAKLLCWMTPAGLEKFFMSVGVPVSDCKLAPAVGPADIEKIMAAAPHYGLEIIPPQS